MEQAYRTIRTSAEAEYVDRKSRFIGLAFPVTTAEEARSILEDIRKTYWDASHHVFAYRLRSGEARFSDDGEPSGTAGKPTLDVLSSQEVLDTVVITVRYFGGTLLGTGGLVRAYTKAAQLALTAAGVVTMQSYGRCRIAADYTYLGKLEFLLREAGFPTEGAEYGEKVVLRFLVPEEEIPGFQKKLQEATDGRITMEVTGKCMAAY